jgi:hypothetical protein
LWNRPPFTDPSKPAGAEKYNIKIEIKWCKPSRPIDILSTDQKVAQGEELAWVRLVLVSFV